MHIFIIWIFIIITVHGKCAYETCIYGQCIDDKCICDPGVYGDTCNKDITDCDKDSCRNNGICIELVNGFACQCLLNFHGSRCQHRRTKHGNHCKKTCYNNGKCIVINNKEKCSCSLAYYGSECEYIRNNTHSLPAIQKCSFIKFRNSINDATCLAIDITTLSDIQCKCYYDHEHKQIANCHITPSPYPNEKCSFKKAISVARLSTLPDPLSVYVCPVNWHILDQYENTQEKVNSVHMTRCHLHSI